MKRLSFLMLLLLSVFATNVFAEGELNIWGGYTRLSDFEFFDSDKFSNSQKDKGVSISGNISNAFTVNLDYFHGDSENAKKGYRVAYLQSGEKKSSNGKVTESFSYSTFVVMVGGKLNFDISEEFSLNGKLFFGFVHVRPNFKVNDLDTPIGLLGDEYNNTIERSKRRFNDKYNEFPFALDMSVGARYLFTKKFGLGLDLGYRPFPPVLSGFTAKLGLNFKM